MPFMNNIKELCLVPGKASGDIASFEAASAPLVSCICTINPVQSGSGEPSPSNIRPITGHDTANVGVVNSNAQYFRGLLNGTYAFIDLGSFNWSQGNRNNDDTGYIFYVNLTGIKPSSNAICEGFVQTAVGAWESCKLNEFMVATTFLVLCADYPNSAIFKTAMSGVYLIYELATATTPTITPTQYNTLLTAFGMQGSLTTITFPDTVYGASLDVGTGVLTIDRAYVTLTSSQNWTYSSDWSDSTTSVFYDLDVNTNIKYPNYDYQSIVLCDKLIPSTRNEVSNKDGKERLGVSGSVTQPSLTVRILSSRASTTQQFKDWLDSNPVHGVYELATPTTTQLTPEQLNSILGENNFYHDGNGPIDITYIRRIN